MTPAAAVEQARERTVRVTELLDAWPVHSAEERLEWLRLLPHADAEDLLLSLPARDQAELILETSAGERRSWMRLLPPDDAADVVQAAPQAEREGLLALLAEPTRKEVAAPVAYAAHDAVGLMNPPASSSASARSAPTSLLLGSDRKSTRPNARHRRPSYA